MDQKVKIWNLEKGRQSDKSELKPEPLPELENFPGWGAFFSPDGKYIAAAGEKRQIALWTSKNALWNSEDQIDVKKWEAHRGRIWNIAFSPDSKQIASGGDDGSVQIWDLTGQQLAKFQGHSGPVRSVRFTADGKQLVSSGDDGTTRLWNLPSQPLDHQQLDSVRESKRSDWIILSQNGKLLDFISSKNDCQKAVEDIDKRQPIEIFKEQTVLKLKVNDLSCSSNRELLASAGEEGEINVWNLKTKEKLNTFQDHVGSVLKIEFSSDSKQLVSAGDDKTIRIWDKVNEKNKGKYIKIFRVNEEESPIAGKNSSDESDGYKITAVIFDQDQKRIISGDNAGYIRFWDYLNERPTGASPQTAIWKASRNAIKALDFSSGNLSATVLGKEGTVELTTESFDGLRKKGCKQIGSFLQNNVDESDRTLCDGVDTSQVSQTPPEATRGTTTTAPTSQPTNRPLFPPTSQPTSRPLFPPEKLRDLSDDVNSPPSSPSSPSQNDRPLRDL